MPSRRALLVVISLWAMGLASGVWEIYCYATTAGETATSPATWPDASSLPRERDGETVVMFVHPECPCSRASLAELGEIAKAAHIAPRIVFVGQDGDAPATTGVANAIRIVDPSGAEATRFGALTSGYVVVYGADGTLRFAGGITGSRGHAGDNMGRRAVLAALSGEHPASHPVFGCALRAGNKVAR